MIKVTYEEVEQAALDACREHLKKPSVIQFCQDWEDNVQLVLQLIKTGNYVNFITYRKLSKLNKNGKLRNIDSPTLITRIFQYVFINRARPLYQEIDNWSGLNCKDGCGLNSKKLRNSVRHRVKSLFYERRDLNYVAIVDQRKCYKHVKPWIFRDSLRFLTDDKDLIRFGVDVVMVEGRLPIGTPVSPLAHHIVMLRFDIEMKEQYSFYIRYADNILIACNSKQEAHAALWRVKFKWWYALGIRSNRWESRISPIDNKGLDFCGTRYFRNPNKLWNDHNKGYTLVRRMTADSAKKSNSLNWGSYFGQLKGTDSFHLMKFIEGKNMKLSALTNKVKIVRKMDVPSTTARELLGKKLIVVDYEIRKTVKGEDNWIKILFALDEEDSYGNLTGRKIVREIHGNYQGLYTYIRAVEKEFGVKKFLPIEDAELVEQSGFIFKGSSNTIEYYDDYLNSKTC